MVSPANPNSTDQTTVKAPKAPEAPKEKSAPSAELARQKIPTAETTKKLDDNSITLKDDLTPLDVNVTKKAQEVLGTEEESIADTDDGLDFFDDLMADETLSPATITPPDDNLPIDEDDGLDFFDDLMQEDTSMPAESLSISVEGTVHKAMDAVEDVVGLVDKVIGHEISFDQIASKVFIEITNEELRRIFESTAFKLTNLKTPQPIQGTSAANIKQMAFIYHAESNIIFTKLAKNKESIKQIHQSLKELNISQDKAASLKIIQLDESQWEEMSIKLFVLVKMNQANLKSSKKLEKEKSEKDGQAQKLQVRTKSHDNNFVSNKLKASPNKHSDLERMVANEFIQEETLLKERAKLRKKREDEKMHKEIDKENLKWERKHSEIKRDATALDSKRRIP